MRLAGYQVSYNRLFEFNICEVKMNWKRNLSGLQGMNLICEVKICRCLKTFKLNR